MKNLRTLVRFITWMIFAFWIIVTFVKTALWLSYVLNPLSSHPFAVAIALVINWLPLPLFIWANRCVRKSSHIITAATAALLLLCATEVIVTFTVGANPIDALLMQVVPLFGMFILTPLHKNESLSLED